MGQFPPASPVPWTTLPRDATLSTKKIQCRPHAAEARMRFCSALINLTWSMMIRRSHSFRLGCYPDVFMSHVTFFRPNAMMRIGRRNRTFKLLSSCQITTSITCLQRQSSLPSPLFPRRIYESGPVFQPNVAMLAGRRRNMTKHAGGPPACSPGQTAEAERIGRVLAQASAAPCPGRRSAPPLHRPTLPRHAPEPVEPHSGPRRCRATAPAAPRPGRRAAAPPRRRAAD